ncbi:type I-G CRISPR-associated helicase/endonuclease Cas3g [Candidatus Poriferisodalis sp.]|uniref:type I-G CRISPR-associated helicase/endonuclease Cas3g n=1 Tax=Candidatus Poriferisodalis sp. TaxID=3101277 RepID=UPI003C6FA916
MSNEGLSADDFADYFEAVHGYSPYPWQVRLTRQVLADERWPDVIDLPTGTGKTAVLDTAIFTLAAKPSVFPRRVVFVIDRRIVVDQVYERAACISDSIRDGTRRVLLRVKSAFDNVATGLDQPVGVSALRGGIPLDRDWASRPDQPWVMVSTVDQFGSKLLFRGYGVSQGMRPIDAGLAGNDCLVILDEVHLSRPFVNTLRDVDAQQTVNSFNKTLLPRRRSIVEMSATPTSSQGTRFQLDAAVDLDGLSDENARLRQIARAAKRAQLVLVSGKAPHVALPKEVLRIVKDELHENERSVGVIVNRVRTAREIQRALSEAGVTAHLITGRMRPLDRMRRLEEIATLVDPDKRDANAGRTVVVATQAIEVGADFSFDALISEACPVDSLRQRVGRLDRRGTLAADTGNPARCWILGLNGDIDGKRPDLIYGDAVRATWREMESRVNDRHIDVGPASDQLDGFPADASAPRRDAPLLLSTHMEAWAQTSPEPVVQPDITDFLHGFDENPPEPEVSIAWRWDRCLDALKLVPPRPAEYLSVPFSAAKAWLRGSDEVMTADVGIAAADSAASKGNAGSDEPAGRHVLRLARRTDQAGNAEPFEYVLISELGPGDTLIVDPADGGLTAGTWDPRHIDNPAPEQDSDSAGVQSTDTVNDLGDEAQWAYERCRTLRLDKQLEMQLHEWLDAEAPAMPRPTSGGERSDADADMPTQSREERVSAWIAAIHDAGVGNAPEWFRDTLGYLTQPSRRRIELVLPTSADDAATGDRRQIEDYYVVVERSVDPATFGGEDDAPSLTGTGIGLRSHLDGVGELADEFANRLGLSAPLVGDLRLAGELHDLGKVDERFQAQMTGHDPVCGEAQDEPLAKSLPGARTRRGEWPPVRHEVASVALVQSAEGLLVRAHDVDLVLHLVASHHGRGRPLPHIVADPSPRKLSYEFDGVQMSVWSEFSDSSLALDTADRFWKLTAKYGHHGLAWLEAIFRLADHRQSARESSPATEPRPEASS